MSRVHGVCMLVILLSASCLTFGGEVNSMVSNEHDEEIAGNGRGLKILGALLMKKLFVKKALVKMVLTKALLIKAKLIFIKLKKLGLKKLLMSTGVEEPEDVATQMDLGKVCNVALDMGESCAHHAKYEIGVQKQLAKCYNVIYVTEGEEKHHTIEYVTTETHKKKSGKSEYYILNDDGTRTPYHPAEDDHPVEYVIENEDGSTSPYEGHIEVVAEGFEGVKSEVQYDLKDHAPNAAKEFFESAQSKEGETAEEEVVEVVESGHTIEVAHGGEHTVELVLPENVIEASAKEIAVDTVEDDGEVKYIRYKPQHKAGVQDTEEVVAFKLKMLDIIVRKPEFKKRDEIYIAKMLA